MPDPNALCRISSTESLEEVDSLKGPMSKQASSSDSVEELESFGEYSRLPLSIGPGFVETPFDNSNKLAVRVKFKSDCYNRFSTGRYYRRIGRFTHGTRRLDITEFLL